MRFAVEEFGSLDVVVNNAGYGDSAPIEEMAADDFPALRAGTERSAEAEQWAEAEQRAELSRSTDYPA